MIFSWHRTAAIPRLLPKPFMPVSSWRSWQNPRKPVYSWLSQRKAKKSSWPGTRNMTAIPWTMSTTETWTRDCRSRFPIIIIQMMTRSRDHCYSGDPIAITFTATGWTITYIRQHRTTWLRSGNTRGISCTFCYNKLIKNNRYHCSSSCLYGKIHIIQAAFHILQKQKEWGSTYGN